MFKKLMKRLTNNPGLKILSVLIAVVLWIVVVKFDEPSITKTYKIPVTVTNEEVLVGMGKVYEVVGQSNTATITVTGRRSVMDKISASDFVATADLSQVDFYKTGGENLVPITVAASRYSSELSIVQKTNNLKITIEDLSTGQFYISTITTGELAEGYGIGEVSVSPNLIKISGPQSVVSLIEKVAAIVNVEGLSADFTSSVGLVLYDAEGKEIESTQLKLSQDMVTVSVQILGMKTVPIRCETTGTPAEGYQFVGLEYAPTTIAIKAEPGLLNSISAIEIPAEAINIEGATQDVENSIDLNPYLPEGVSLVNPEENKVAVKAVIQPLEVKDIKIPVADLQVLNLPADWEVTFGTNELLVSVRGRSDELAALQPSDIKMTIDLAGLEPGNHKVLVTILVDEKFEIAKELFVEIVLADNTAGEAEENGTAGNEGIMGNSQEGSTTTDN